MRLIVVAGARPNFVKVAPVLAALERRGADTVLVHTGQHYDAAMSDVFFAELGLRAPDHHLDVGSGSHAEQTARVMVAFEPVVASVRPDVVVVVGDVNSTMACAVVAAKGGPRVAHVEAGLRSRDWSMPEEVNRVVTDRVSDHLFAPSADAVENLRVEGYRDDQVHLVGNVMVDSLLRHVDRARQRPTLADLGLRSGAYGIVTLHRPSNVDDDVVLARILGALGRVAAHLPLVFPAHPRAAARVERLGLPTGVRLVPPAGYLDFLALEAGAALVLTDSGGIQEETTVLGVPCLTLRDSTERPITVAEGTNRVVGNDPDRIASAADVVLADGVERRRPELWDGRASERIAAILTATTSGQRRPTASDLAPGHR